MSGRHRAAAFTRAAADPSTDADPAASEPTGPAAPARGQRGPWGPWAGRAASLPPETKLVAAFVGVLAVVATPRQAIVAHLVQGLVIVGWALLVGIGPLRLARRLAIEAPFVAFALFLPLVGRGQRVEVGPLSLSEPGLWAAWNILAKGTLGLAISVLLTATTPVPALLVGLERLRLPRPLVLVASFMVRYVDVLRGEAVRMRIARLSRGQDARWLWQAGAVAATAGALFVRAYERGERVHLAMLARGWSGTLAPADDHHPQPSEWVVALALSVVIAAVAVAARIGG